MTESDISEVADLLITKRKGKSFNDLNQEHIQAENKRKFGWTNKRGWV